jgi:hypothetical protein
LDPADVIWHFGVNAELAALAATLSKAGDAENGPPVADRAEKWATRVAGARVDPPFAIASAKHVLRDEVILVHFTTRRGFHNGHLPNQLKVI